MTIGDNGEENCRLKTMLYKKLVTGHSFLNIFQLPKAKAEGSVVNENNDNVIVNKNNASVGVVVPSSTSIDAEKIKPQPSRKNVSNGVDIGQFVTEHEVQQYLKNETGRERLYEMFSKNHLNQYSPQLKFISIVVSEVAALSSLIFSYRFGQNLSDDIKRQNRGTLYGSRFLAKRRFNDQIMLQSFKYGLFWAFKLSSFTAIYLLVSQSISTYRNKTSPLEYGIAGAITGGLFRFNMGPRGIFAAALISGPAGLLLGSVVTGLFFLFNASQDDRHYFATQRKLFEKKENQGILPPLPPLSSTTIKSGFGGES